MCATSWQRTASGSASLAQQVDALPAGTPVAARRAASAWPDPTPRRSRPWTRSSATRSRRSTRCCSMRRARPSSATGTGRPRTRPRGPAAAPGAGVGSAAPRATRAPRERRAPTANRPRPEHPTRATTRASDAAQGPVSESGVPGRPGPRRSARGTRRNGGHAARRGQRQRRRHRGAPDPQGRRDGARSGVEEEAVGRVPQVQARREGMSAPRRSLALLLFAALAPLGLRRLRARTGQADRLADRGDPRRSGAPRRDLARRRHPGARDARERRRLGGRGGGRGCSRGLGSQDPRGGSPLHPVPSQEDAPEHRPVGRGPGRPGARRGSRRQRRGQAARVERRDAAGGVQGRRRDRPAVVPQRVRRRRRPRRATTRRKGIDRDPYQDLYNKVANDMLAYRQRLTAKETAAIRQVAQLKFARSVVPEAFGGYLAADGGRHGQGEPAAGRRRPDVRAREPHPRPRLHVHRHRERLLREPVRRHAAALRAVAQGLPGGAQPEARARAPGLDAAAPRRRRHRGRGRARREQQRVGGARQRRPCWASAATRSSARAASWRPTRGCTRPR